MFKAIKKSSEWKDSMEHQFGKITKNYCTITLLRY